ncbi:transglutaminase-like domain-containing protein [Candidatus Parabeggiatoa sp. HSG14]|uniref:transglutaminase-like domain-containing protein n=1 Tax=Candidatus Parabeggiatoa sp. HSG14 TaxID=3055593 RepID=UPI0025A8067E|nr:transglutaminase-like domain-containing protein [Thiotrichales bacterium HSG14]
MSKDANFWNNKWQQSPITYGGRALRGSTERILCDVKGFITVNDAFLSEIIRDYRLRKYTPNETVHAIQNFVVRFLDYVGDDESSECSEFWQFPFETLQSRIGDCEDGAILMASLMIQAGVPAYRIKVCAGFVQESPTAPEGGHAYCVYLADRGEDSQDWVVIDWCYYEDSDTPPEYKPLAKNGGYRSCYKDIWFTFNNEFSWNQGSLEIEPRRISRNRSAPLKGEVATEITLQSVMEKIKSKVKN